jgi:small subunit ribosomal protein S6
VNRYEVLFIIAAAVEDEKKEAVIETVKGIIADGGEVVQTEIMGLRRLAYPILKKNEGYYALIEFSAPPELPIE